MTRSFASSPPTVLELYVTQKNVHNSITARVTRFLVNTRLVQILMDWNRRTFYDKLAHYGLRVDDLYGEGLIFDTALARAPKEEQLSYKKRVVRALDAKFKKEHLPHGCHEANDGHHLWLTPHVNLTINELQEVQGYDRHNKFH